MLSNHVTRFSLAISLASKNSDTLSKYAKIDSFSGLNSPTWQNIEFNPILVANCSVLENDSTRFNNHLINMIHICTNWNEMLYACVPHYTTHTHTHTHTCTCTIVLTVFHRQTKCSYVFRDKHVLGQKQLQALHQHYNLSLPVNIFVPHYSI